jgi:hypothetical protein
MKLIKLTTFYRNVEEPLYVNPLHIGHMYPVPEKTEHSMIKRTHTRIGVTTHNNGGFEVIETLEQINKLIEKLC